MTLATIAERAPEAREVYLAYVGAGFTDEQALYLTGAAVATATMQAEGRRIRQSHGLPFGAYADDPAKWVPTPDA